MAVRRLRRWYASLRKPGDILPVTLVIDGGAGFGYALLLGQRIKASVSALSVDYVSKHEARRRAVELARAAAMKALER